MLITEVYYSKFITFWAPTLKSFVETNISKKSLGTSLAGLWFARGRDSVPSLTLCHFTKELLRFWIDFYLNLKKSNEKFTQHACIILML